MPKKPSNVTDALQDERLIDLQKQLTELRTDVKEGYVTRDQFETIKKIVYGLCGAVLLAVGKAVIALVVK